MLKVYLSPFTASNIHVAPKSAINLQRSLSIGYECEQQIRAKSSHERIPMISRFKVQVIGSFFTFAQKLVDCLEICLPGEAISVSSLCLVSTPHWAERHY
jgi:hypothetical protein